VSRVLAGVMVAAAAHLGLVLWLGGYTWRAGTVTVSARSLVPSVLALLALGLLRLALLRRGATPAAVGLALLLIYLGNGRTLGSGDTLPARYLPLSVLREADFDLDEFPFLYADGAPYFLRRVGGRWVSDYPVGAALLALPVYVPAAWGRMEADSPLVAELEKLAAALAVALSAVAVYATLRELIPGRTALLFTAAYALGGSSLSVSSQALWQHGASQLGLAAALYCLVRGRRSDRWVGLAGFPLAFAVIARPADLVLAAPAGMYVLLQHRRRVPAFVASSLPPLLFHLAYQARYFDDPLHSQWSFTDSTPWSTPLGQGLAGLLVSPGRGLFVYSPVFLFSLVGLALAWRRDGDRLLRWLGAGAVLTVLLHSRWMAWWGGWTYGPRYLADLTPILALALYPVAGAVGRRGVLRALFLAVLVWSVGAHAVGAYWDDGSWNARPNIDQAPGRLWVWSDNQLVEPVHAVAGRALLLLRGAATSRSAPARLAASYRLDARPAPAVAPAGRVHVRLRATNEGEAVWLAWPRRGRGVVTLGWRWRGQGGDVRETARGAPLPLDLHPGQSHGFELSIGAPATPGRYALELELVAEGVGWFSQLGTPPARLAVDISDRAAGDPRG
jgi:hypothetical protein